MRATTVTARWVESKKYWQCNAQKEGKRKSFYSSVPGRRGKSLCERSALDWLDSASVDDPALKNAYDEYMAYKASRVGAGRQRAIRSVFRSHFLDTLGRRKMSQIRPIDIQRILDGMRDRGLRRSYIVAARAVYAGFNDFCKVCAYPVIDMDLVEAEGAPSDPRQALQQDEIRTIYTSDVTTYFGKDVQDPYINLYRLGILLGLRKGELLGLRMEDIDGKYLHIRRALTQDGMSQGKTANASRDIPISPMVHKILDDQVRLKSEYGILSPWLFCDLDGEALKTDTVSVYWRRYCDRNGIRPVCLYSVRHTMISMMAGEMPEQLLKRVVGHSSAMDTFGTYGHAMDHDDDRIASILDATLEGYLNP